MRKVAPHSIIVPLVLALCHYAHLGAGTIDQHIFGPLPMLEGSVIHNISHYALPVLAWFAAWAALKPLGKVLIFIGNGILRGRNLLLELSSLIFRWFEDKLLTGMFVFVSRVRAKLAAQIRKRGGEGA